MCISESGDNKHTCCCGCPLICGVLLIAICEVFSLITAIHLFDLVGIAFSSVVLAMFTLSLIKRNSHSVRKSLFLTYLATLLLFVVYAAYYVITQDMGTMVGRFCDQINRAASWDECADDLSDVIWVFLITYAVFILLIRTFFCRILYYYSKEAQPSQRTDGQQKYQSLAGDQKNSK